MTDLTNDELNEAVATALGWERDQVFDWQNPRGLKYRTIELPWAASVDVCLKDILPAVEEDYSVAFTHRRGEWRVWLETDDGPWREFRAPTLARAICLCFIEVMKVKRR